MVKLRSIAGLVLQLAVLGVLAAAFFLRTPQVSGPSMEPQIRPGETVLIDTLAYRFSRPHRGDIVAFSHTAATPELYIKRVIGVGGDRVRIEHGIVYVNGKRIDEPYVRYTDTRSFPEVTVAPHMVFVLGDNRANSEDSRFFGAVPDKDLIGRALAGIWPIARAGSL